MKDINSVLKNTLSKIDNKQSFYQEPEITEKDAQVINYIFKRLAGIIPAFKYSTSCAVTTDSIRVEYTYALINSGIKSIDLINAAINKIRDEQIKFLPSPGEFISYCKLTNDDIGAPNTDDAYKEAIKNTYPDGTDKKWSHECVRHAYHKSDPYFLRNQPYAKSFARFKENYEQSINDFADGKIMQRLETDKNKDKYREYVGRMTADIKIGLIPSDASILSFDGWLNSN